MSQQVGSCPPVTLHLTSTTCTVCGPSKLRPEAPLGRVSPHLTLVLIPLLLSFSLLSYFMPFVHSPLNHPPFFSSPTSPSRDLKPVSLLNTFWCIYQITHINHILLNFFSLIFATSRENMVLLSWVGGCLDLLPSSQPCQTAIYATSLSRAEYLLSANKYNWVLSLWWWGLLCFDISWHFKM